MQAQELPADGDYSIRIVVVDNDADGSAARLGASLINVLPSLRGHLARCYL